MSNQEETRFVKLQQSIGKLLSDQGAEVALGLIKLGNINHEKAKNIGALLQEIGHMLSNKHNDHEFELKEEYLKKEYLDDPLHRSMLGFHSYQLVDTVKYLMEGLEPKEAIETVRFKYKMPIRTEE